MSEAEDVPATPFAEVSDALAASLCSAIMLYSEPGVIDEVRAEQVQTDLGRALEDFAAMIVSATVGFAEPPQDIVTVQRDRQWLVHYSMWERDPETRQDTQTSMTIVIKARNEDEARELFSAQFWARSMTRTFFLEKIEEIPETSQ